MVTAAAAEAARRQMTQAIAAQGSRGYETQAATVQPSKDVAAAAQRSILAAPVELNDEQRSALTAGTDELAGSAELYADAQRQIFKTGQDSALAAGNAAYDGFSTLADAQNFQLDRYRAKLAENEAARLARSSGSAWDDLFPDASDDLTVPQDHRVQLGGSETGFPDPVDSTPGFGVNMERDFGAAGEMMSSDEISGLNTFLDSLNPESVDSILDTVDDNFRNLLNSRVPWETAAGQMRQYLMSPDGGGLSDADASALLTPFLYRWMSAFSNVESLNPEVLAGANAGPGTIQRATPKREGRPSIRTERYSPGFDPGGNQSTGDSRFSG
tara:strand:+ start:727 stop:1710 length:984 start_codon:yes stop_codon:yes gene_type:complete